jgi:hypothetical protein
MFDLLEILGEVLFDLAALGFFAVLVWLIASTSEPDL